MKELPVTISDYSEVAKPSLCGIPLHKRTVSSEE
jgi:hypothetical protein